MCDCDGCNDMAAWIVSWIQKSERNSVLGYTYISSHVFCEFDILNFDKIINMLNWFLNSHFSKKSFVTMYFNLFHLANELKKKHKIPSCEIGFQKSFKFFLLYKEWMPCSQIFCSLYMQENHILDVHTWLIKSLLWSRYISMDNTKVLNGQNPLPVSYNLPSSYLLYYPTIHNTTVLTLGPEYN